MQGRAKYDICIFVDIGNSNIQPRYSFCIHKGGSLIEQSLGNFFDYPVKNYSSEKLLIDACLKPIVTCESKAEGKFIFWMKSKQATSFLGSNIGKIKSKSIHRTYSFHHISRGNKKTSRRRVIDKRIQSLRKDLKDKHNTQNKFLSSRSVLDRKQSIKITCDASFCGQTKLSTWSTYYKTDVGVSHHYGICPESITTTGQAEVYAIMMGVKKCVDMGYKSVLVETDNLNALNVSQGDYLSGLISRNFKDVSFEISWIRRNSTNEHKACDNAARKCMRIVRDMDKTGDNFIPLDIFGV